MVETRLRASSSVCIRGDSGKLPRIWMSLSVKSMASCGCIDFSQASASQARMRQKVRKKGGGVIWYVRPRHQGSQWSVSCDLFANKTKHMISTLALKAKILCVASVLF